ncbi:MAG: thermonuclease family protein [Steroidobacteraceae bacterium]
MSQLESCASKTTAAAFACGMALSFGAWTLEERVMVGAVTGVIDGDTLKVQLSSGPVLVRLANIDAPERIQPGGGAATRALHGRVLGEEISLHVVTQDRDQPIVAVVFLGDENINAWMVKQGYAWAYRGYTQEADYCVWENAARALKRGLWADKHWVAPWDWRMSRRDSLYFVSDYSNASAASCMREISQTPGFDE